MSATKVTIATTNNIAAEEVITIQISQRALMMAGIAAAAILLLILLVRIVKRLRKGAKKVKVEPKAKKKAHKPGELHVHIKELKEAMIAEMRGTSKQNWIMIMLTVVFITVSVFSAYVLKFFGQLPDVIAGAAGFLKSLVGR
jgi:predicted RND superfamily exporter protein